MTRNETSWPIRGLGYFLRHPRLWLEPMVFTLAGWCVVLGLAIGVAWTTWPGESVEGWWGTTVAVLIALGWGAVALVFSWLALIPVLIGLAYEALVKRVMTANGVELGTESTISSMKSSAIILLRMLPFIVMYPILALICNLTGILAPLGLFIGQFGLAHIATMEAGDLCLSVRGLSGSQRWRVLQTHRRDILASAFVGALLSMLLSFTFVGWLLFLPAMFTGAALWIGSWELSDAERAPSTSSAKALPAAAESES
ncbi:MAG: hypothetical protein PF961_04820 [Planctomycetota bacterium]|jgi:hypothetical protein|nr:hypothetical protein [Planctomycetota bacterium]